MKRALLISTLVLMAIAGALRPHIARAQAAAEQPPDQGQGSKNGTEEATLKEVVVSAEKVSESAQTVPVSISAVGSNAIQRDQMHFLSDVAQEVPGIVFPANNSNIALPAVRGIGATIVGQSDVAFYLDGVAVPTASPFLVEPERIEVLKGPQGTYFGTTAVSGAISVVTPTPTQTFDSSTTLSVGNYKSKELSGYISGGLADDLAVGIYYDGVDRSSYFTRLPQNRVCTSFVGYSVCEPGSETQWGVRIKAVYKPFERLTVTASYESQESNEFDTFASRQLQSNAPGFALGAPVIIQPYVVERNWPDFGDDSMSLSILRAEYDLDWARLVSISGYAKTIVRYGNDLDGTSSTVVQTLENPGGVPSDQFSQELQILSPAHSLWQWVAGLYYLDWPGSCTSLDCIIPEDVAGFPYAIVASSAATSKSYAPYGQVKIPLDILTHGLALTLGARYTRVDRTLQAETQFLNPATGATVAPPVFQPSATQHNSNRYSQFTPRVVIDYQPGNTLYYGSFSRGFQPGQLGSALGISPVQAETLDAYEIGTKSNLSSRLRLNNAAYYYDYSNSQLTVFIVTPSGFNGTEQVNAKGVKSYGLESELTAAVSSELTASLGLAYDHAYYKSIPGFSSFKQAAVGNVATPVDITGRQAIRAPRLTVNAELGYDHPLPNGGTVNATLAYFYMQHYPWDPAGLYYNPTDHNLNATVGYATPGSRWRVTLWGHNLLNCYQQNGVLTEPFGTFSDDAPPRTYGVSVTFTP